MSKSNYLFFKAVEKNPDISKKVDELYRTPHEEYERRINQIESILNILDGHANHPSQPSAKIKFELMLQTTREEQDEANSSQNKP